MLGLREKSLTSNTPANYWFGQMRKKKWRFALALIIWFWRWVSSTYLTQMFFIKCYHVNQIKFKKKIMNKIIKALLSAFSYFFSSSSFFSSKLLAFGFRLDFQLCSQHVAVLPALPWGWAKNSLIFSNHLKLFSYQYFSK